MGTFRQTLRQAQEDPQDAANQSDTAHARAAIYHALAEALAWPVAGVNDLLLDAARTGARVLDSAACRRAALTLAELHAPGLEALRKRYTYLIGSPDRRPMALYESLQRQGCLMGPTTWDVERHYRSLGLAPANGESPDHASVELAFLGHLAIAEAEAWAAGDGHLTTRLRAEQRDFLRTHAGAWLPVVGDALAVVDDPFYAAVGRLLSGFLAEELNGDQKRNGQACAEPNRSAEVRFPALKDPAGCTLCGLCVGSCPLAALQVIESVTETALTLNPSQCVGCDRCLRICPEGVLFMSFGDQTGSQVRAANGAGHRVLRRSSRATCPNCGRPTVSQAELDAVFARLQVDPATQQCLSLCVECKSWSV